VLPRARSVRRLRTEHEDVAIAARDARRSGHTRAPAQCVTSRARCRGSRDLSKRRRQPRGRLKHAALCHAGESRLTATRVAAARRRGHAPALRAGQVCRSAGDRGAARDSVGRRGPWWAAGVSRAGGRPAGTAARQRAAHEPTRRASNTAKPAKQHRKHGLAIAASLCESGASPRTRAASRVLTRVSVHGFAARGFCARERRDQARRGRARSPCRPPPSGAG